MIRMIAAVSTNGVIGINGKLPFHYPEDLKFFKQMTNNSTIIMGRKTFESIGKPLPNRRNLIISKNFSAPGTETFPTLNKAFNSTYPLDMWICGGASIYQEGLQYAQEIYLTLIPEHVEGMSEELVKFPWINPQLFSCEVKALPTSQNSNLSYCLYKRI